MIASPDYLEQVVFGVFEVAIFEFGDGVKVELVEVWVLNGDHALHGDDIPPPGPVVILLASVRVFDEDVVSLIATVTVTHNRHHFTQFPLFFDTHRLGFNSHVCDTALTESTDNIDTPDVRLSVTGLRKVLHDTMSDVSCSQSALNSLSFPPS